MRTFLGCRLAALAAALMAPTIAWAAEPADVAADRADARASRVDTGSDTSGNADARNFLESQTAQPNPKFTFLLTAPLSFNSNPEHASSHSDGDGHADPGFNLKMENTFANSDVLTLNIGADMDLYFDRPANDATTLKGSANYDFKSFKFLATPYLNYGVNDIYASQFGDHTVTTHTVAVGLNYKTPKKEDDNVVRPLKVSWNIEVARREASVATSNQNRAKASFGLEKAISDRAGWSLTQTLLYKGYTGGTSDGRDDYTYTTTAVLSLDLNATGLSLRFTAQYEHNESNRAGKDYSFWDIGPQLRQTF